MFRVNIYSLEPLTTRAREGVNDGIDMVAEHMGQRVVKRELIDSWPLTRAGTVDPVRIGSRLLNDAVELHVMAVPLDSGKSERLGLAGMGRGWAFVDTTSDSTELVREATAHEGAHALGFLDKDSSQASSESVHHCQDDKCVMHR
ncbi:MAG: hypothetical protein ACREHG_09000, partial [Candidatus Saccharimonadales bacterium]